MNEGLTRKLAPSAQTAQAQAIAEMIPHSGVREGLVTKLQGYPALDQ